VICAPKHNLDATDSRVNIQSGSIITVELQHSHHYAVQGSLDTTMTETTRMLLVTVPEWGHLSPFLHMAASIERNWDSSKGTLQVTLASMEQVCGKHHI
jgi:hypothetical protein